MNYGWDNESPYWDGRKAFLLVEVLSEKLNIPIGWSINNSGKPYLEINGLYPGVRIRKLTNLSDDELRELSKKADEIYLDVMKSNVDKFMSVKMED